MSCTPQVRVAVHNIKQTVVNENMPIAVASRSKAGIVDRGSSAAHLLGIVGSNTAVDMDVCLL